MQTRLIFCASPGRCGTNYLAHLLATIPGAHVRHEGDPDFVERAFAAQWLPEVGLAFWRKRKLPIIWRTGAEFYIETSHLFVNGFFEPLLELGHEFSLIVLRRPHREVALSFWRRGSIPARTERGFMYLISPGGPVMRPLPNWRTMTDYQLCYWYTLEVEARQEAYTAEMEKRGWPWIDFPMEWLNDRVWLQTITEELGLPEPDWDKADRILGKPTNENPSEYADRLPEGNLDEQEEQVERQVTYMHKRLSGVTQCLNLS